MLSKNYLISAGLCLVVIAGCSKDAPGPVISTSSSSGTSPAGSNDVNQPTGKSGSTARFAIAKGHLFVINNSDAKAKTGCLQHQ
jgi:hypothetical protein